MSSLLSPASVTPAATTGTTNPAGSTVLTTLPNQGTVSSTGLGSGLDINSIVTQLVAAEGNGPTALLNAQQQNIQAQLSAYGQFQAAVSALQASVATLGTTAQFQVNAATVADKTVASATAATTAAPGTYTLEVDALASGAKLTSGPVNPPTTAVGTGTLTIAVGPVSFQVAINSSNNTLAGIASAINSAGAAHGVAASILTANDGARLILTSAATGAVNAVSVTQSGGDGGLASLVYDPKNPATSKLTLTQGAQDASIKLDGFTYTSSSNVVTTALSGVTISLAGQSAANTTTTLTIASDPTSAEQAVETFVGAYNTLAGAISQLSSYDAATGTAGPLLGDSILNSFVSQVSSALNTSVAGLRRGPFSTLAEIGITANLDGTLSADSAKLGSAFTNNYAAVAQVFSAPDGVGTKLNNLLNEYTQPQTGVFAEQTISLKQTLTDIAKQRTALSQRLADLQANLFQQYNAMDALVAQLKATGTSVQAQLDSVYYPGKSLTPVP